MPDSYELAWAAGFFDGEGHTRRRGAATRGGGLGVHINQNDRRVLDRFAAAVGRGNVGTYKQANGSTMYAYRVHSRDAAEVLAAIWPWLSEMKRVQAEAALEAGLPEDGKYPTRRMKEEER